MSKTSRITCLFLILASAGAVQSTGPATRTALQRPSSFDPQGTERTRSYQYAYLLATEGKYLEAEELFRKIYTESKAAGDLTLAGRSLTAAGSAQFALFRYQAALDTYLQARSLAEAGNDVAILATLNANISSLLLQMGDLEGAAHAAELALEDFQRKNFAGGKTHCLIQLGVIRSRQGQMTESARILTEAIDGAYEEADLVVVAEAWDHLGEEYLAHGQLASADAALTEAFRVRKVHHLRHLTNSYYNLGRLRLAQGDLGAASLLLDEAVSRQGHPDSWTNPWSLYHERGRVRQAAGDASAALADFRKALDLAREWRVAVLPADFTRISSEGELQGIYTSFIESAIQTGRSRLASEAFRAAEENRAASLHALLRAGEGWRAALPADYRETLAQLRNAETSLLEKDDGTVREKARHLRARLVLMEARAGSNTGWPSEALLERVQKNLSPDAALLSFHLGERQSYLWAVTRKRFCVYTLPDKAQLTEDISRYAEAVRTRNDSATGLGRQLYAELFGQLDAPFREQPRWLLALDEQLFRVPFGALVSGAAGAKPVFLAERHAVAVTTGAVMLASLHREPWRETLSGGFVGLGDAIYNTADPRWHGRAAEKPRLFPGVAWAAQGTSRGPALARLAGSAREIEDCARAWGKPPWILLEGTEAGPGRLRAALENRPGIVHIAAHFLQENLSPSSSVIALSLKEPGKLQLLSPLEITRYAVKAGVVVLSGCDSGRGQMLPASGLMGMTRAWLAGGARAVVASHWPTPDDNGPLFIAFYKHLRHTPDAGPAKALQEAQRDVIRAGGWRSNPQYWSTYFVAGDQ